MHASMFNDLPGPTGCLCFLAAAALIVLAIGGVVGWFARAAF